MTAIDRAPRRPGSAGIASRLVRHVPVAWRVALLVLAFHGAWIGLYLATGNEPRDFIKIGWFQGASDASDTIKVDPDYVPPENRGLSRHTGYDGQFSYYMALDLRNSPEYLDFPAYRYSRILYPVLARALALGDPERIPVAMILINWLALGGATLALAAWLRRRSLSPWLALLVGLYPGLFLGVQRNLTEPLAYALAAGGIYLFDYGGRRRLLWAGLAFGLAGLARQTTVVFPLCLLAAQLLSAEPARRKLPRAAGFGALAVGPALAFAVFLQVWLGDFGRGAGLETVPFAGIFLSSDWALERQGVSILTVAGPALIVAGLAVAAVWRGYRRVEFAFLLVNVMLFVVLLSRLSYRDGYTSVARVTTGVIVAAVVCLPWLAALGRPARVALLAALALVFPMLPVIAIYGFGG